MESQGTGGDVRGRYGKGLYGGYGMGRDGMGRME